MLNKLIFKDSKYHYRLVLVILFISIGLIISIISGFVGVNYQLNAIHKEFDTSAKNILAYKQNYIYTQTSNFENYITAVSRISEFETFLQNDTKENKHEKSHIAEIMMTIAYADPNIMQFRFIDKHGHEAVRVEREAIGYSPYSVGKKSLQNKSDRYYFEEIKKIGKNEIWFSKIDLNEEYGKIVKPIIPTMRVAKPFYVNNEFKGILIINIFMEDILNEIIESELFNVAIIDKDSHILTSNFKNHEKYEWTRYLENAKDIRYTPNSHNDNFILNLLYKKEHSTFDISNIIKNGEGLKIVLEEKTEKILEYTRNIIDYLIVMGVIILIISLPISMALSRYPIRLHEELNVFKDDLETQLDIIDKYVYMSSTDLDGNITDVSSAFSKLTGYSKDELIGVNHRILKSPDTPVTLYKEMWDSILKGESWTGEMKNIGKNGDVYWVKNHVAPIIKNDEIAGFTAIRENITDQKRIEEISIKDELTGAYNRRFFNQIFTKEIKRAKRQESMLCIAMIDIDYFKKYNDTYGHIKGDEVLQKVVSQISEKLQRPSDYLFRVGGEEFMVIYSDMKNNEEAIAFSSILIKAVEDLQIEHKDSECSDVVTISLGLLNMTAPCIMDEDAILQRVDELLYRAKDAGRNQLVSQEC
ncbi:MAG: sensor domain-containing diguanylate cyclase [Sulfurimonas sp.]|nr:sensor domain-containing diguanylate cyclase [Sulfurimonas sp.]